jgi:deoxyribonuclease-4
VTDDLPLGAHHSIAGGTPRAVERGLETGCRALQIFVKSSRGWNGRRIEDLEARAFRRAARAARFARVVAHSSYLINLASPFGALRRQSVEALVDEILRCHRLGIRDLILHPGSHGGDGESSGVARIARGLDEAFSRTVQSRVRVLLETAAGQGASVGHRFEHLRDILGATRDPRRLGVCLDTCHVHAAGYDLVTRRGWEETFEELDRMVGLRRLAAIHANDSKQPRGSRVDRHEHIGRGYIGSAGFRNLMTDPRLLSVPKFLETPKDERLDFDRRNLSMLRKLARSRPFAAPRRGQPVSLAS